MPGNLQAARLRFWKPRSPLRGGVIAIFLVLSAGAAQADPPRCALSDKPPSYLEPQGSQGNGVEAVYLGQLLRQHAAWMTILHYSSRFLSRPT